MFFNPLTSMLMILLFSILSFFFFMVEWNVISLVFAKIGIPPVHFLRPFPHIGRQLRQYTHQKDSPGNDDLGKIRKVLWHSLPNSPGEETRNRSGDKCRGGHHSQPAFRLFAFQDRTLGEGPGGDRDSGLCNLPAGQARKGGGNCHARFYPSPCRGHRLGAFLP